MDLVLSPEENLPPRRIRLWFPLHFSPLSCTQHTCLSPLPRISLSTSGTGPVIFSASSSFGPLSFSSFRSTSKLPFSLFAAASSLSSTLPSASLIILTCWISCTSAFHHHGSLSSFPLPDDVPSTSLVTSLTQPAVSSHFSGSGPPLPQLSSPSCCSLTLNACSFDFYRLISGLVLVRFSALTWKVILTAHAAWPRLLLE